MISRSLLFYLLIAVPTLSMAQMLSEKSALKSITLGRYEKANKQVRKLLAKDSTNAVAQYLLGVYFFAPKNSGFNIDSSYIYTMKAWRLFGSASTKSRERMRRFPIDSVLLTTFRERIDSAAFARAKQQHSEQSYNFFLERFTTAREKKEAIDLRDEAAFQDALAKNSLEGFDYYLTRYPTAKRAVEAKKHYEKLRFLHETRTQRLEDFEQFLKRFPSSPHREEAIQQIFNISTASGNEYDYQRFIEKFPAHPLSTKAHAIIRSLDVTNAHDSLAGSEEKLLIPVLHDGKFGFMNAAGLESVPVAYNDIAPAYQCGNVVDELLVLDRTVVSTQGVRFNIDPVDEIEQVGNGFWLATRKNGCGSVLHESGFTIGDGCIANAKMISGKFLAIQQGNAWTLWALNGIKLTTSADEDVSHVGDVVIFKKNEKYRLATTDQLAASANRQPLKVSDAFDAFKPWQQKRIWLKAGAFEGVMDQSLNVVIGFEEGALEETFFGATRRINSSIQLFNNVGKRTTTAESIQYQAAPWLLGKRLQQWYLLDPSTGYPKSRGYDSAYFKGPFVIALHRDTTRVYFNEQTFRDLLPTEKLEFIPGQDSSAFLAVITLKDKALFDQRGKKMFSFNADKIQHAGQQFFIVVKKDKKGLIGSAGKPLTAVEFDAVGSLRDGTISLLKDMRFGLFSIKSRKIIKPEYAKNVVPYNADLLAAYKNGSWGFIDWNNKTIGKFEFEEIKYWNDTLAMVKKNDLWTLIAVKTQQVLFEGIQTIRYVADTPKEKVIIIETGGKFGVLSNRRGVVIPINFTDLVNVGSPEIPVYFTEKHVEEASVFVVIYYSSTGKFLRKEVYEAEDYERIYCAD